MANTVFVYGSLQADEVVIRLLKRIPPNQPGLSPPRERKRYSFNTSYIQRDTQHTNAVFT